MPIVREKAGDLFDSQADTYVITVNTIGAMGKGIARTARNTVPGLYKAYRHKCTRQGFKVDELWLYRSDFRANILCFPTKREWWFNSRPEWIEANLQTLLDTYESLGIERLAIPPLGAKNGGLDYDTVVRPLMYSYLDKMEIPVEIWLG